MKTLPTVMMAMVAGVVSGQDAKPAGTAGTLKDGVKHVDAAGAKALLDAAAKDGSKEGKAKVVILDVRTADEFKAGHLKGAVNVDFMGKEFEKGVGGIDKDAVVVVHCQAGGRSARSLPKLKALGFKNLVHLDGGFGGWEGAGLPVEK
jgi:rhodanese-related sulfurtransferase